MFDVDGQPLKGRRSRAKDQSLATNFPLGHDEIVRLLTTNPNEEKAANTKLNAVALREGVNSRAAG
jgi:hypothetical protein